MSFIDITEDFMVTPEEEDEDEDPRARDARLIRESLAELPQLMSGQMDELDVVEQQGQLRPGESARTMEQAAPSPIPPNPYEGDDTATAPASTTRRSPTVLDPMRIERQRGPSVPFASARGGTSPDRGPDAKPEPEPATARDAAARYARAASSDRWMEAIGRMARGFGTAASGDLRVQQAVELPEGDALSRYLQQRSMQQEDEATAAQRAAQDFQRTTQMEDRQFTRDRAMAADERTGRLDERQQRLDAQSAEDRQREIERQGRMDESDLATEASRRALMEAQTARAGRRGGGAGTGAGAGLRSVTRTARSFNDLVNAGYSREDATRMVQEANPSWTPPAGQSIEQRRLENTEANVEMRATREEERARVPGWARNPNAPRLGDAEQAQARRGSALRSELGRLTHSLHQRAQRIRGLQAAGAAAGILNQEMADARAEHEAITNILRSEEVGNYGVPQAAELARMQRLAPALDTPQGFVSGATQYRALWNVFRQSIDTKMRQWGYERERRAQ